MVPSLSVAEAFIVISVPVLNMEFSDGLVILTSGLAEPFDTIEFK